MITQFKCPPKMRVNGKKIHDFDFCINECPNKCCPSPVLRVMVEELKGNHHKGDHISITSLQHCLRQVALERTVDYAVEPKFHIWQALRGTLVHAMFEYSGDPDRFLCEVDYVYEFNNIKVHGRLDMYDMQDQILFDFKTGNDWAYQYVLKEGQAKEDHIMQTNFYRFLLEHGKNIPKTPKDKPLGNFPVKKIVVIYISMKSVLGTDTTVYEIENRTGEVKKYDMKDVPLIPYHKVRSYVRPRAAKLNKFFEAYKKTDEWQTLPIAEKDKILPPPVASEKDQGWLCGFNYKMLRGYCGVREHCSHWRAVAESEDIGYLEDSL